MKLLVAVKRVIDPYVKIRIKPGFQEVETQNVKHSMNPFDEIAVEEAIRLMEKGRAHEVVVVSIGSLLSQETLRHALALGATRGILVQTEQRLNCLHIAKILHKIIQTEQPGLVLMGKQAIDDDSHQVAQMVAALLDWPQATCAYALNPNADTLSVTRETDIGLETLALCMPAVVSVDLRLNEPRYATLPNIMKAKQKPLETFLLEQLELNLQPLTEVISLAPPPARALGVKVESVAELVHKLRFEAKVLGE